MPSNPSFTPQAQVTFGRGLLSVSEQQRLAKDSKCDWVYSQPNDNIPGYSRAIPCRKSKGHDGEHIMDVAHYQGEGGGPWVKKTTPQAQVTGDAKDDYRTAAADRRRKCSECKENWAIEGDKRNICHRCRDKKVYEGFGTGHVGKTASDTYAYDGNAMERGYQDALNDLDPNDIDPDDLRDSNYMSGYNDAPTDENQREESRGPQEEDIVVSNGNVSIVNGPFIGKFSEEDEADEAIKAYMQKHQFWPNVWNISDHGNASIRTMSSKTAFKPTHTYNPIGFDRFFPMGGGSPENDLKAGEPVEYVGEGGDPARKFVRVRTRDPEGKTHMVDRKSLDKIATAGYGMEEGCTRSKNCGKPYGHKGKCGPPEHHTGNIIDDAYAQGYGTGLADAETGKARYTNFADEYEGQDYIEGYDEGFNKHEREHLQGLAAKAGEPQVSNDPGGRLLSCTKCGDTFATFDQWKKHMDDHDLLGYEMSNPTPTEMDLQTNAAYELPWLKDKKPFTKGCDGCLTKLMHDGDDGPCVSCIHEGRSRTAADKYPDEEDDFSGNERRGDYDPDGDYRHPSDIEGGCTECGAAPGQTHAPYCAYNEKTSSKTASESWDTGEVELWFNNDEGMYHWYRDFSGNLTSRDVHDFWIEVEPNDSVDPSVVDWSAVAEYLNDDYKESMQYEGRKVAQYRTASSDPSPELLQWFEEQRSGDEWGDTIMALFNVCDVLRATDNYIPAEWEFRPGLGYGGLDEAAQELQNLDCSAEELVTFGNWLNKNADSMQAAGLDY